MQVDQVMWAGDKDLGTGYGLRGVRVTILVKCAHRRPSHETSAMARTLVSLASRHFSLVMIDASTE